MPGPLDDRLSRRERQIMDVLYAAGEASAGDVHARLADAPSYTTVRTLLRILEEKGHLSHRQAGVKYVYSPLRPRGHAGRSAFERVLRIFFDGSLAKAVAAHLGEDASDLPPEELQRLADIIRRARKKGR
jgi:BlaI family transcriptional regulator, penicillinase repressor